MKPYGKEEYLTDIDWLRGRGIEEDEGTDFIFNLLYSNWVDKKIEENIKAEIKIQGGD